MRATESALLAGLLSLTIAACAGSPVEGGSRETSGDDAEWSDGGLPATIRDDDSGAGPVLGGSVSDSSSEAPLAPDAQATSDAAVVSTADSAASSAANDAAAPEDAAKPSASDGGSARDAAMVDAAPPPRDAAPPQPPRDAATIDASQPVRDAAPPPMEAAAPSCEAPQRLCANRCVDTRSDSANCGNCGTPCAQGESCVESKCYPPLQNGCMSRSFSNHAYLFCSEARTFREARQSCIQQRMDLVIVDDVPENDFVRGIGAVAWLGASDLEDEGRFRQVVRGQADRFNGAELPFTRWANDEPNNDRHCVDGIGSLCLGGDWVDEDCGQIFADGNWNDGQCTQNQRFVCEAY